MIKKCTSPIRIALSLSLVLMVMTVLSSCPSPVQEEQDSELEPVIPEMIVIGGGDFDMGNDSSFGSDEKPEHEVTISGFSMGKYEVTHSQFINFLNMKGVGSQGVLNGKELIDLDDSHCAVVYSGSEFQFSSDEYYPAPSCPVAFVTWYGAVAYCEWLSDVTGSSYRLPTEAEWEYAARGGSNNERNLYSGSISLDSIGWYLSNSGGKTHSVGTKTSNSLGLFDMSGNVNEWCRDYYDGSYYSFSPVVDPENQVPSTGGNRVLRGGAFNESDDFCTVSYREISIPEDTNHYYGFRVVGE